MVVRKVREDADVRRPRFGEAQCERFARVFDGRESTARIEPALHQPDEAVVVTREILDEGVVEKGPYGRRTRDGSLHGCERRGDPRGRGRFSVRSRYADGDELLLP
jgi:hypothetical protein